MHLCIGCFLFRSRQPSLFAVDESSRPAPCVRPVLPALFECAVLSFKRSIMFLLQIISSLDRDSIRRLLYVLYCDEESSMIQLWIPSFHHAIAQLHVLQLAYSTPGPTMTLDLSSLRLQLLLLRTWHQSRNELQFPAILPSPAKSCEREARVYKGPATQVMTSHFYCQDILKLVLCLKRITLYIAY